MNKFSLWSKDFIFLCIANFFYFGSFYLILPILPQYVVELGGTPSQIGLVTGYFTLASVVLRPYLGKYADEHGRKRVMLFGVGFFALLFVVYSQVQEVIPLYILRILHGVAHGAFIAACFAYVAELAPVERRGEVLGVFGVSNVVAMALFPAWGIAIIKSTGNFAALFTLSFAIAAAAFLAVAFVKEVKPQVKKAKAESIFVVARQRAVWVASLTLFAAATTYGAIITFLPVYAPERGISNFGVFFSTYAGFTLISRVVAGKLSDRFGRRAVIIPFMCLVAIAVFFFPLLYDSYLLMFIGGCFGLGIGAFMPALSAYVVDETAPKDRGSALAFFTAFMDLGITAGSVVLGLVGGYLGYDSMFVIGGIIVVMGILLFAIGTRTSYSAHGRTE
ncbi:MFS transporter [Sporomusa malonica]|uniref:Predicted arabinose efflux permease, MFS family n=1 Tax=Sporomusa malonica TaxID=112901 RepID=A0A1W2EHP0_9FIRM|nr:MFS transporter [Sporomusa malonica]SMD09231.1 Predicted arabinose efflux permease, MFS family [Sporomusa malonica]